MPISLRNARKSISNFRPFKRRSTRSALVSPIITSVRGSLYLNDESTNYALISPVGFVEKDLNEENSTILMSSIESQQKQNGAQHTDGSFVKAESIENETETSED